MGDRGDGVHLRGHGASASLPAVLVAVAEEYLPHVLPHLEEVDVRVLTATTGEEAVRAVYRERPGLLLVGTHLPGLSPWEVIRLVRDMADIPVTVLDPEYSAANARRAFGQGAGNYLAWPLPPEVVAGRLRHLLGAHGLTSAPADGPAVDPAVDPAVNRAVKPPAGRPQVTDDGWARVDPVRHEASVDGRPLELTVLEFDLLDLLVRHPGQVLTYERLLESAWGLSGLGSADSGRVKAAVGRLRRKLATVLTEDNELTFAILHLGGRIISPAACSLASEVMPDWRSLWRQRLRWKRGAVENCVQYGLTGVTWRYWGRQLFTMLGVVASALYLATLVWAFAFTGSVHVQLFWLAVTGVFVVERVVTLRKRGWRRMLAAASMYELVIDYFLQACHGKAYLDALLRRRKNW